MQGTNPRVWIAVLVCSLAACGDGGQSEPGDDAPNMHTDDHPIDAPGSNQPDAQPDAPPSASGIKTVFVIMMENTSWSTIDGSSSAPYINSLVALGAHAENYWTPPGNHPSELNYLWLEGGSNFGVTDDLEPSAHHFATHQHLVYQLEQAGISWKAYAEGVGGSDCPLTDTGLYATKHVPFLFFDDVTDGNSRSSAHCRDHVRPYGELAGDLAANTVARYVFIVPDVCDDMHGAGSACGARANDIVRAGDDWLSHEVPKILASSAYQDHGALFILWDEGGDLPGNDEDGPIGAILLSPQAKPGYASTMMHTHGSTLRTVQEIFHVAPMLGSAAGSNDLSDMFEHFP